MVKSDRTQKYMDFGNQAGSAFMKTGKNMGWFGNNGTSGAGLGTSGETGTVPWAAIAKAAKTGYGAFTGHDDSNYSDLEESIIYPTQGAAIGSMFGPWGAAGGAAYGLGYSFKDDMGLKDSNFLTQLLYPIGLGDGGGLRIGGKSVLDLG